MLGPILHGSAVTLAPPSAEHLDVFRQWFADPAVTRYLPSFAPLSAEQEEDWYRRMASSENDIAWTIVVDGRPIGNTGLRRINWRHRHAWSGLAIGERDAWGHGYATEAVRLRTRFAFEELGMERLESESFAENVAMHRALERAGYRRIGVRRRHFFGQGRWHDEFIFELLREEWPAQPPA